MKPPTAILRFAYATGSRPLDGYTIKRGVGIGGFGEVYFAVSDAGKEVAVKRIQRNLDVEIRGVSQCLNLKHPNLVAIHDIRYDDEGQAWVVMEYVRGESLKDVIERNPNGMPLQEVLDWFYGIAGGVGYLHDHGIVHRDLKPGNVFLDETIVKIGDYGLSKYISCSRRSGQTESVGTFHYMAPEIGRGVYGKEIDVYALGIILYEMLTGRVPFDGESSHEIIMKHLTAAPDLSPLPEMLRPSVQRALYKDPEKRFRSVSEMLATVQEVAARAGAGPVAQLRGAAAQWARGFAGQRAGAVDPESDGMYFGPVKQLTPLQMAARRSGLALSEEPIARAVRDGVLGLLAWWRSSGLTGAGRVLVLVAVAILGVANAGWIVPVAIILGSTYLVYFGLRAIFFALFEPSPPVDRPFAAPAGSAPVRRTAGAAAAPADAAEPIRPEAVAVAAVTPVAMAAPAVRRGALGRRKRRWQEVACEQLRARPVGERTMELTGSMLMSSLAASVSCFLLLIVAGLPVGEEISSWTRFAWLALTSVLGTWLVLIPAKLWEGQAEDAVRRRFVQVLLGVFLGAIAFGLGEFLGPNLARVGMIDTPRVDWWSHSSGLFARDGTPAFPAFLVYFAGLFLFMRWWRLADPLRTHRFNIWSTLVTVLIALVWQMFWPFPQPWGLLVPAAMAIAVQLSAPWVNNEQRNAYRRTAEV